MKVINKAVKTEREYIFTQGELKKKLGIKGDIICAGLFSGRSPKDIQLGVLVDSDEYFIMTIEKKEEE